MTKPNMHRTQILLPHAQLEWLRKEADRHGVSVSEIVRHAVRMQMSLDRL